MARKKREFVCRTAFEFVVTATTMENALKEAERVRDEIAATRIEGASITGQTGVLLAARSGPVEEEAT